VGSGCRARGSADYGCTSSGLGAGQHRWVIFSGNIYVTAAEQLEGQIDATAANGVHWGSRSALVATLSRFLELMTKLEVLGSRRSADWTEDKADAL
jgi:hypothetical protein